MYDSFKCSIDVNKMSQALPLKKVVKKVNAPVQEDFNKTLKKSPKK